MLEAKRAASFHDLNLPDDDDDSIVLAPNQVWEAQARALQRAERSATQESRSVSFAEEPVMDRVESSSSTETTRSTSNNRYGAQGAVNDLTHNIGQKVHQATDRAKSAYKAPELIKYGSFAGHLDELRDMSAPAELVTANSIMQKVALDSNMWDVALLVGAAPWSKPTSVYVAFLALLNAFMQGTFIYILYNTELTQPTFTDETLGQLRTWRRNIAQYAPRASNPRFPSTRAAAAAAHATR